MADPKITFKLELDDSQISSQLNSVVQKISQLNKGQNVSVHVNADISGAQSGMKTVTSEMNTLNGAQAEVNIDADISAAQSDMDTVETDLNALDGSEATVNVDADISNAQSGTDEVTSDMNTLDGMTSTVNVNADVSNAQSGIDTVESELNALDGREANVTVNTTTNSSSSDGSSSSSSDSSSSGNSFLGSVGSLVKTIFKEGSEYETSRAKASTLMPKGTDLNEWDSTVSELSAKYGQPAAGYNEAAYSMLSAGQSYENLPELLDLASQLAVGGFTDVPTATGLLASMANAYGSTDYKQMANDALLTQNYGIIDVGPMSHVMPNANATASLAGVSLENLMATMAAITNKKVSPEVATTQVNALINELTKTGSTGQEMLGKTDIAKQWAKDTGGKARNVTLTDLMEAGYTMGDVARSIGTYAEDKGASYADLFSSQEAGKAIGNLLGKDNAAIFDNAYQDMINGVDAVTPAFETMADTTSFTMEQIMTQFQNAGVELFTALAPAISQFLEVLTSDDFKESLNKVITTLTNWLASDGLNNFINAIISASNWLLDTFNSGKSLGEIIGELFSKAITVAVPLITKTLTELAKSLGEALMEAIISAMPEGMKEYFGIGQDDTYTDSNGVTWTKEDKLPMFVGDKTYQYTPDLIGSATSKQTETPKDESTLGKVAEGAGIFTNILGLLSGNSSIVSETIQKNFTPATEEPKTIGGGGGQTASEGASRPYRHATLTWEYDTDTTSSTNLTGASSQVAGAMETASGSMTSAATAAATTATNATKVSGALSRLSSSVSSAIRRCNSVATGTTNTGGGGTDGNKSVGMSYVPFDGYVATLHKGEAVLTAAQASTYRMGGGTSVSGIDYTALASAMAGMTMTMDSRTVGRIVEKSVSQAQGARVARSTRGVRS